MDLVYWKTRKGNFGDDLNRWFWDEVLPGWRGWAPETALLGVGTILKAELIPAGRRKLVLGSGTGYGRLPDIAASPAEWDIRCVRGPRSALALGLPAAAGVVDPTVLLPELAGFSGLGRGAERLFVPHHGSMGRLDWSAVCAGTGLVPVDPSGDAHEIIRRIATARSVIAESMHAAIIADAFRVPWQGVAVSGAFNRFKWQDWAESLGIELEITRFFPGLRALQALARRAAPGRRSPAPSAGAAAPAPPPAEGAPARLFAPALAALARRTLRRVDAGGYRLSDQGALDARRRRFARILEEVRRDYG